MDHEGKTTPLRASRMNWFNLALARDGGRLAMEIRGESSDIWVYDLARGILTPVTSSPAEETRPVWTPDGRRVVFASNEAWHVGDEPVLAPFGGTGEAEPLTTRRKPRSERTSFHPSGRFLALTRPTPPRTTT